MTEKKQFTLGRVANIVQHSKEIGSDATMITDVRQAEVTCACGHTWRALKGNGLQNVGKRRPSAVYQ